MHVAPLPGSAGEHLADRLLSGRDGRRRGDFSGGRRPKRLCRHTARRSDRATRHPLVAQKRPLTPAVSSGARSATGSAAVVPDRYRFGGAGNLDQRRQQLGGAREAPFPLLERSDAPVELKPHAEIGDMTLGIRTGAPIGLRSSVAAASPSVPAAATRQGSACIFSMMAWISMHAAGMSSPIRRFSFHHQ
jgi:hypothetical protein